MKSKLKLIIAQRGQKVDLLQHLRNHLRYYLISINAKGTKLMFNEDE
jgi:hypothetical protein